MNPKGPRTWGDIDNRFGRVETQDRDVGGLVDPGHQRSAIRKSED